MNKAYNVTLTYTFFTGGVRYTARDTVNVTARYPKAAQREARRLIGMLGITEGSIGRVLSADVRESKGAR